MSKNIQINTDKNGIEAEKLSSEENTIIKKDPKKSKTFENEEIKNSNFAKEISSDNYNFEKNPKLSNSQRILEKSKNKYKKLNSDKIQGYNSLKNNNLKFNCKSELERFNKIKKKLSEKNNNMNKRVKIFVPASEYLDLLEEIDAEEDDQINNDTKNKDINNNSEEEKLSNFFVNKMFNDNKLKKDNYLENMNPENKSDEVSSLPDLYYQFENYSYKKNINKKGNKLSLMEKRQLKYLKDFDEFYNIFINEVLFKYRNYKENINEYKKSILILKKNYLYVFELCAFNKQENNTEFLVFKDILNNLTKKYSIIKLLLNSDSSFPLLCLNFNLLTCILLINKNKNIKEFQIKILGTNKTFSFILNEEKEFNKYIYLIRDMINNSEGFKKNKLGLSLRNNIFYKNIYITPLDFESTAKTGDILLFKSLDTFADLQRLYTCDNYDHVAIILKENNKIKIFESTSMGKCSPLSWIHFKMLFFNLVYDKIAYRELIIENKNEEKIIEEKCKNFFKEIEGKKYYLSISKFLCCQKPDKYEYEKKFEESKGFCCSALVAALYIKIGIAKLIKSVHSIKPGDFEQRRNKIYFEKGYFLGAEKILEFSE